jgi:uncharacterized protein YcgI (DUF1989 family)
VGVRGRRGVDVDGAHPVAQGAGEPARGEHARHQPAAAGADPGRRHLRGVHDTLLAACDAARYELLGAPGHDNCTDNLHAALASAGLAVPCTPSPLNLFENAPPGPDGALAIAAPVSTPGSHVTLRAELDALVVLSACPQDLAPTNGPGPRDAHYEIEGPT